MSYKMSVIKLYFKRKDHVTIKTCYAGYKLYNSLKVSNIDVSTKIEYFHVLLPAKLNSFHLITAKDIALLKRQHKHSFLICIWNRTVQYKS